MKPKKIEPLVRLNKVTKSYYLQDDRTFKELIPSLLTGKSWAEKHVVFSNVSFEIKKGETVGIVGENGAGKSTIMKLIAGVTYPNRGSIKVTGKVAPLIELTAGFHHELTGYENIFLSAAILGMHKKEVELVVDDIIAFSEIDEYLHTPIKRYSTGMVVRLAFSIAIHSVSNILLIDEVLAVGDIKFQRKCLNRMKALKKKKDKIIVFVSHSEEQVKEFCDRALLLQNGKLTLDSTPEKVFKRYNSI